MWGGGEGGKKWLRIIHEAQSTPPHLMAILFYTQCRGGRGGGSGTGCTGHKKRRRKNARVLLLQGRSPPMNICIWMRGGGEGYGDAETRLRDTRHTAVPVCVSVYWYPPPHTVPAPVRIIEEKWRFKHTRRVAERLTRKSWQWKTWFGNKAMSALNVNLFPSLNADQNQMQNAGSLSVFKF